MGGKKSEANVSKKEEDMQGQSLRWKRAGGDRRAEQISCVGTCNPMWQQQREQPNELIRMKRNIKMNQGIFQEIISRTLFLVHLSIASVQHWCFIQYCFFFFPSEP